MPERTVRLTGQPDRESPTLPFRAAEVTRLEATAFEVLRDATQNYPAWEDAIGMATSSVHVEIYIVHPDATGRRFRDCLVQAARGGAAVRVLYDWFGCLRPKMYGFWTPLLEAGGEVRAANPPSLDDIFSIIRRDHRKLIVVDREVAFVSGLCVGDPWWGGAAREQAPWRDTGVRFEGPAAEAADDVFLDAWKDWGAPVEGGRPPSRSRGAAVSRPVVQMGIVATSPEHAPIYRLELMLAALASSRLWVTDAYFVPTTAYTSALAAAASRGVDVRVLVPGSSDLPWLGSFSRTFYRRLITAGVRVFEWNGSMLHSKSAVVDGRIARIGSTNQNISSWLHNWELDVLVDDAAVGRKMEEMYASDLEHATEIVLSAKRRVAPQRVAGTPRLHGRTGRARRVVRNVALFGSAIDAAVRDARHLGPAEARSLAVYGALLLALGALVVWMPRMLAYPVAVALVWIGLSLLARSFRVRRLS